MSYSPDFVPFEKPTVLVADPQLSAAQLLSSFLNRIGKFSVVAEVTSGLQGLSVFRKFAPALVICGLSLPEMSGVEMMEEMRRLSRNTRFLVYCGTENSSLLRNGLEMNPQGFVHKTETLEVLQHALNAVASGANFLSPFASRLLSDSGSDPKSEPKLNARERTVLQMVAEGLSSKQVADRLSVSTRTVEHYRFQVMRKLDLPDITAITRYAARNGLISL